MKATLVILKFMCFLHVVLPFVYQELGGDNVTFLVSHPVYCHILFSLTNQDYRIIEVCSVK